MRERPILFSAPMVRGILNGTVSVTRRVIKNVPEGTHRFEYDQDNGVWEAIYGLKIPQGLATIYESIKCPYGKPGDRLWVRETWADVNTVDGPAFTYRADNELKFCSDDAYPIEYERYPNCVFAMFYIDLWHGVPGHGWRPSIHMPKVAARIWLDLVGVRVERLQDITEEDAEKEGAACFNPCETDVGQNAFDALTARTKYISLWDSLNAKRGFPFESNSWVWVIEFKLAEGGQHE